jgi:1-acyl-sn-glycerol-3-phosphate acyltransferase
MIRKMRATWRRGAIIAGFAFCVPLHYLWKIFGARSPWPQIFLGYTGRRCGMRIRVEGKPLTANVLYAANHVSWLDILAMGGAVPAIFVARADLTGIIRWASSLNDSIYITRDIRSSVKGQAGALRQGLEDGRAVCLFPEGTTNGGHDILPFRPSLLAALFPPIPGIMVQPVVLDFGPNVGEALWVGEETYELNAGRLLERPGKLRVTMRFLPPIDPAEAGDRKLLTARAREEIIAALPGAVAIAAPAQSPAASEAAADPL